MLYVGLCSARGPPTERPAGRERSLLVIIERHADPGRELVAAHLVERDRQLRRALLAHVRRLHRSAGLGAHLQPVELLLHRRQQVRMRLLPLTVFSFLSSTHHHSTAPIF